MIADAPNGLIVDYDWSPGNYIAFQCEPGLRPSERLSGARR